MSSGSIDYALLSVNAGIIGAIFIFFSIASQATASTVFEINREQCAYGFDLKAGESQIAVGMAGGIIIVPFAVSSILVIFKTRRLALIASAAGFALIVISALITLVSLSCRLPTSFITTVVVLPTAVTVALVVVLIGKRWMQEKP
jgi:hypothetical protein